MHWKEQLKAKIENAVQGSENTLVVTSRDYCYTKLQVYCDDETGCNFAQWRPAVGRTNGREFCAANRSTLLLMDVATTSTETRLTFGYLEAGSWNEKGPVWPYFDFDSLP